MDLWQFKNYIHLVIAFKLNQFVYCQFIIEIVESFRGKFALCFYPGAFIQIVIVAKIVFI